MSRSWNLASNPDFIEQVLVNMENPNSSDLEFSDNDSDSDDSGDNEDVLQEVRSNQRNRATFEINNQDILEFFIEEEVDPPNDNEQNVSLQNNISLLEDSVSDQIDDHQLSITECVHEMSNITPNIPPDIPQA
ncbi:hypothetical protein J6590_041447 [Homalodisca vitripennis]|nr:hypothetical protein J6590_041447 [Homalodisca vitripennis]